MILTETEVPYGKMIDNL